MNKSFFLILTIVILSEQSYAQKGFYIKPYLESKTEISYYYGKTPYNNNPYFNYENKKITFPNNRLSPINMGLLVGYTFKNKVAIETGIGQEINASGYKLNFHYQLDSNSYGSRQPQLSAGTAGIKIPLLIIVPLFKFDSVRNYNSNHFSWKLNLKFGINFYKQPKGEPFKPLIIGGADSIIVAPNTRLDYRDELYTINDKSILYQIGLESEFNFKRLKGLCLSFYYLYGRKDLSTISVRVTVNQQINYYYNTYGRGSGFCLQLTKKISMNPNAYKRYQRDEYYKKK